MIRRETGYKWYGIWFLTGGITQKWELEIFQEAKKFQCACSVGVS